MADHDSDGRERRRRRSRSYSSGPEEKKNRSDDSRKARDSGRERDRRKYYDDKYDRRRNERPRHRSGSPDNTNRKRRRSYSRDRESTKRRRSPRETHARPKRHRSPSRSRSPPLRRTKASRSPPRRTNHSRSPSPAISKRSRGPLPSQQAAFNGDSKPSSDTAVMKPDAPPDKQKPNFAPTGKLAAETNTVAGTSIVLKYNEPPESRKPPSSQPWRLYVFKSKDLLETLELSTRSCWLFGRERSVVDFPIEHPSCSKQHAVLQFRYVEKKNEFGDRGGGVRPYVIDLESANGTRVNGEGVPERRFVEVKSGDVLGFGESTREYVVLLPPAG
ncbi:hypothetical protein MMC08_006416 [Hypocenomyce scalaris]|nr:hypothetical protein [Hypocenomyce scalaris]